jgi:hypothetical protein
MSKIMKFVVSIEDEDGKTIATKEGTREVPYIEEIEEKGFRAAFNELETAALELTKETRDAVVSDYLSEASKKNEISRSARRNSRK